MRKILEFEEYSDGNELTDEEMSSIKEWVKKYEKYYNFYNNDDEFIKAIDQIVEDCIEQLSLDHEKRELIKEYLEGLYTLSDGMSVIMSPNMEFNANDIDQVQRFQY